MKIVFLLSLHSEQTSGSVKMQTTISELEKASGKTCYATHIWSRKENRERNEEEEQTRTENKESSRSELNKLGEEEEDDENGSN